MTLALRAPSGANPTLHAPDLLVARTMPLATAASPTTSPSSATAPTEPEPVARPEYLSIRSIGVSTALIRLGLQPDKTVEVPADPRRAGWYESGPAPGQPGAAVVLGHVDSVQGPAVFYRLAQLHPGDLVRVRLSDGSVARFAVRRVATFANDDFPAEQVYVGDPDRRSLNLVTCGGWYDADLGGWQGNVVVFTDLVRAG